MAAPLVAVINDDPDFLAMMQELGDVSGDYEVVVEQKGGDAIALLHKHEPSLVILDVRMEESHTGASILREMRHDPELADVPVVVCTADIQFLRENEQWLRDLRSDWLEKPFDLDDLMEKIDHQLYRRD